MCAVIVPLRVALHEYFPACIVVTETNVRTLLKVLPLIVGPGEGIGSPLLFFHRNIGVAFKPGGKITVHVRLTGSPTTMGGRGEDLRDMVPENVTDNKLSIVSNIYLQL